MASTAKASSTGRSGRRGPDAAQVAAWARERLEAEADREQLEKVVRRCEAAISPSLPQSLQHDLWLLQGMALSQLARCREALERLEAAGRIYPDSLEVALERAVALYELCRFEEAEPLFEQVARSDPAEPWAHHYLGLLAERRGAHGLANRCFGKAEKCAPGELPRRLRIDDAAFEAAIEEAVARLPARLAPFCAGIPLEVEPVPSLEDLLAVHPPLSPSILGLFRGPPLGERGERGIVLFRHNLERSARSPLELVDQIGVTLLHEIGHLIGLDEEALWRRGLE